MFSKFQSSKSLTYHVYFDKKTYTLIWFDIVEENLFAIEKSATFSTLKIALEYRA